MSGTVATGSVTGDDRVSGLVGEDDGGTVQTSYWDVEATGQRVGLPNQGGEATGLSTDAMQGEAAAEHMSALDFEEIWMVVTDPDEYPVLRWPYEKDDNDNGSDKADDAAAYDEDDGIEDTDDGVQNGTGQDANDDDTLAGPGVVGAVGSILGAGYILHHWQGKDGLEEEQR